VCVRRVYECTSTTSGGLLSTKRNNCDALPLETAERRASHSALFSAKFLLRMRRKNICRASGKKFWHDH